MALVFSNNDRIYYLIVRSSIPSQIEQCVLFDKTISLKKILDIVVKTGKLVPVSAGEATIDVDNRTVTCYGGLGSPLRTRVGDSAVLSRFLFGENENVRH